MKLYLLICEQDTDAAWGCNVKPFLNHEDAQTTMQKEWEAEAKAWKYAENEHSDEDECSCKTDEAIIRDDSDVVFWRIEEHDLDVRVAVNVHGGLVQGAIANAGVNVEVYDTDVSDFPDDGEEDEAAARQAAYDKLASSPDWGRVW